MIPGAANHPASPSDQADQPYQANQADYLVKTYRYLRLAMIGVVGTLGVSVVIERLAAGCWQTSLSGYYYTPVRAVFVGGLCALGVCLIAIKGATAWEDTWFNFAGIMAPAVALLPTTVVDQCYSVEPPSRPVIDGELAPWVLANVRNNTLALLIAGFAGLALAAVLVVVAERRLSALVRSAAGRPRYGLFATLVLLVAVTVAYLRWDEFPHRAHGFAAVAMFAFLALGIAANANQRSADPANRAMMMTYGLIAAAMAAAGVGGWFLLADWAYRVLVIEVVESALVMVFWLAQTRELWHRPTGVNPDRHRW